MTNDQESVAATLQKPTRRAPWIIGGVATLVIAASAVTFGPALASQLSPAPAPTATVAPADTVIPLTSTEQDAVQQAADAQQAQIAADQKAAADAAAAQAAADAAAAQAASKKASATYAAGQAPKGTPLPHHTETDPNNGNYGQQTYADPGTFCASGSGSTINGIPECD